MINKKMQFRMALALSVSLLIIVGLIIYHDAYRVPFLFDDIQQILQNPRIQSLNWPWGFLENTRRPILYATLAFDLNRYGPNPFGFHIFNIVVHILAGVFLFLLIFKTCRFQKFSVLVRRDAVLLSLGASLLWLSHPIQTQAVTYVIQRAESLMGLFFLMSVYFSAQYLASRKMAWVTAAGLAAVCSGLTKEVALALPLVVLLYDRAFFSRSLAEALRDHGRLYIVLSLTWAVMLYLYLTTQSEGHLTAGFGMKELTPWLYAINQPRVILHYLSLIFFPTQLVFYYDMPAMTDLALLIPQILLIVGVVLGFAVFFRSHLVTGFLGLCFFLILAPSSSFIPIKDLIFEYRVYLSLACIAVMVVVGMHSLICRWCPLRIQKFVFVFLIAGMVALLGRSTMQRNQIYLSEEALWKDVIRQQPWNSRAYNNLGEVAFRQGRLLEAKESFLISISANGQYAAVYANVAVVLAEEGKFAQALAYARRAIAVEPDFAVGYYNLGVILNKMKKYDEAVPYFKKAKGLGFRNEF